MLKYLFSIFCLTVVNYTIAYLLSARVTYLDYKNFGLILLGTLLWVFLYSKVNTKRKQFAELYVLTILAMFSVPLLTSTTEPMVLRRLIKDVLAIYTLVPLTMSISMLWGKWSVFLNSTVLLLELVHILVLWVYYFLIGGLLSVNTMVAIIKTNNKEAVEFCNAYLGITGIIGIALVLLLTLFSIYKLAKLIDAIAADIKISKIVAFLLIVLTGVGYVTYDKTSYIHRTIKGARSEIVKNKKFSQYADIRTKEINKEDHSKLHLSNQDSFALVLSESQNRTHMQAYGYARETTPYLNKGIASGNILLAKNVFSCDAVTWAVMRLALTEKTQADSLPDEKAVNIIEMAKHAGYRVVWITNQLNDTIAGQIAHEGDEVYWLNNPNNDAYMLQKSSLDINIVNKLQELKPEKKTLYVVHLLACHSIYSCRYSDEFNKWDDGGKYENSTNSYDNSMLYNDFIMEEIRKTLFNKLNVSAMLYVGDHGEEAEQTFRHGTDFFLQNYQKDKSFHDIVKIPMYLALSDTYKKQNLELVKAWSNNSDKYFTNDMIYDTILGLLNIKCQHYKDRNDFTSFEYQHDLEELTTITGKVKLKNCL